MTRRGLLASLAAALAFDPERALWVPGKKTISIAKPQPAPFFRVIPVSGGTAPYRYTVVRGELPPGVALDRNTGLISGIPSVEKWSGWVTVQINDYDDKMFSSDIRL